MKVITILGALLISVAAIAADLHPIVEVQSGYLFGAIADGKWIKAEEAAKALQGETTYHVYGLTQSLGQAKGGRPTLAQDCGETLAVSLSPKPEKGVIALATVECIATQAASQRYDSTSLLDAVRDFLKTKGIEQPK